MMATRGCFSQTLPTIKFKSRHNFLMKAAHVNEKRGPALCLLAVANEGFLYLLEVA